MEIMESIKRVNKTQAVKKCAADTKKVINTLLTALTDYTEMQAELWDRGWYEVKNISLSGLPTIKAEIILEDNLKYGRVKRVVLEAELRMDGEYDFTYNIQQTRATRYYTVCGLEYHEEINGLN